MRNKNERVELEMRILRFRGLTREFAREPDSVRRVNLEFAALEHKQREIDD